MYELVYYVRRTEGEKVYENRYPGEEFRLKRHAVTFLRGMSKTCFIERGYAVEDVKDGLNCYKTKMNNMGIGETIEQRVRIEKR